MFLSCRISGSALALCGCRVAFAGCVITALSSAAFAYRPFDGTDAAVANFGEMEVELALTSPFSRVCRRG